MLTSSINNEKQYFRIRKGVILEEWRSRRIILEKRIRDKHNDFSSSNDHSSNRLKDRMKKALRRSMKNQAEAFNQLRQRRQSKMPYSHWEKNTMNNQ